MAKRKTASGDGDQMKRAPLSDIRPDKGNARRRNGRAKKAIANSFEAFGAARSVVIDGSGVVRAGNGTLEAAKAAGVLEVLIVDADADTLVAVRRSDWSETEARAYGIADNRTGDLSDFDPRMLPATINELAAEGFDVGVLNLDTKVAEDVTLDDLVVWDSSELEVQARFSFSAPLEMQAKIRALLAKSFPGVSFEETTVHG